MCLISISTKKNKMYSSFLLIQSLIQIDHKLNWFDLKRDELMTIFVWTTYKIDIYRHTSSSRQIHDIFCWLKIIHYCPDGENGNVHFSSSFLKATSLIFEAQLSFAAHQKYILSFFFSLWWMIKGIWALFSLLYYISVKQEAMAG